ncbi:MAG: type I glyceraldehyde-3-phosphate dehydrogenase [Candidatus Aenigmatarchaeota archaeon]
MLMNVAINGFGRIGRCFLRATLLDPQFRKKFKIVAINDLTDAPTLAHLLKHDTVHGTLKNSVSAEGDFLKIDKDRLRIFAEKDPQKLPWKRLGVDTVIESTGFYRGREGAELHLKAGAKRAIISAPPKGDLPVKQIVLGVNEGAFDKKSKDDRIISMASCTTNCLAPMAKILDEKFGIENGIMTTVHAYTNDQKILDFPHKDLRRARACAESIIPTTTGAAKSIGEIMPGLKGKLDGISLRVPVPDGSLVDLTVNLRKEPTADSINKAFLAGSKKMKGILQYADWPVVSSDIIGNPASCIFDPEFTKVIGKTAKVFGWYDNEWGYSNRLRDLVRFVS